MQKTLLLSISLLALASCKRPAEPQKPQCMYTCDVAPIAVVLDATTYTQQEMDTVIIWRYEGDGTFTHMLGSGGWMRNLTDSGQYVMVDDDIHAGTDYKIEIPGAGQTYLIQGVVPVNMSRFFEGYNCNEHPPCTVYTMDCSVSGGNYNRITNAATTIILTH